MEAVSVTAPVNAPLGVIVMDELFPAVAPAMRLTLVPTTVKSGTGTAFTVTGSEAVEDP